MNLPFPLPWAPPSSAVNPAQFARQVAYPYGNRTSSARLRGRPVIKVRDPVADQHDIRGSCRDIQPETRFVMAWTLETWIRG